MSRPVGVSAGGLGLLLAWLGGATMAHLTGATPVVIVLAAGAVLFAAAVVAGSLTLRSVIVGDVRVPSSVTQGEPFTLQLEIGSSRPVWTELRTGDHVVASGWASNGTFVGSGVGRAAREDRLVRSPCSFCRCNRAVLVGSALRDRGRRATGGGPAAATRRADRSIGVRRSRRRGRCERGDLR